MNYYKAIMDPRRFIKIPTIFPCKHYDPQEDVENLKFALLGKDSESDVIAILAKRSNPQRLEIARCYSIKYSKDLDVELSGLYSSKFRKVLLALLQDPFDFLACEVEKGLESMVTDDELISEVLCSRSNDKIKRVVETYERIFGKTLAGEIESDHHLSSNYKELLAKIICCSRNESRDTDEEKARQIAATLHNAVQEDDKNKSAKLFSRILARESYNLLCLIFDDYRALSGRSIEESIKEIFSGDLEYAYLVIVRSVINKPQFYAERLEAALQKTLRRDDHTLIRVFVSRAEIDLEEIKREYLRCFHKTLYNAIRQAISGPYQEIMLTLLNTP